MGAKAAVAMLLAGLLIACGARIGDSDASPGSATPTGGAPSKSADPLRGSEPGTGQGIDEREPPK